MAAVDMHGADSTRKNQYTRSMDLPYYGPLGLRRAGRLESRRIQSIHLCTDLQGTLEFARRQALNTMPAWRTGAPQNTQTHTPPVSHFTTHQVTHLYQGVHDKRGHNTRATEKMKTTHSPQPQNTNFYMQIQRAKYTKYRELAKTHHTCHGAHCHCGVCQSMLEL